MSKKHKLITTPLYYANASPHIGHAFTTLLADVINRTEKRKGNKTFFVTGLDEHGQKVEDAAKVSKEEVNTFLKHRREEYIEAFDSISIEYDYFQNTSSKVHKKFVRNIISALYKDTLIYKGVYTGYYSISDETFLTASQVENVDGKLVSIETRRDVKIIDQDAYFLRIENHKEWLQNKLKEEESFLQPERKRNEISNMLKSPEFSDLCISRKDVKWGVKFPFDKENTLYVWVDALLGYYSSLKSFTSNINSWKSYDSLHIVGKEIVKFHSVYLPIILKEAKLDVNQFNVYSHGWILMNGEKMSKSLFNTIKIENLVNRFGSDETRYYLASKGPIKNDSTLSEDDMKETIETDLANKYSNLLYRTTSMIKKYSITMWKAFDTKWIMKNNELKEVISLLETLKERMNDLDPSCVKDIIECFKKVVSIGNVFIDSRKPWTLHKKELIAETELTLFISSIISIIATIIIENIIVYKSSTALWSFSINKQMISFFYKDNVEKVIRSIINVLKSKTDDDIKTIMLFKREK